MSNTNKPHGTGQPHDPSYGDAVKADVQAARQATEAAVRHGAEAIQQGGRATGEMLRRSTQVVAEGQRQIARETVQTLEDTNGKMAQAAQGAFDGMRRYFVPPSVTEGGLRDMQQAMAGLAVGVAQANLRAIQELVRLSNPVGMVELRQSYMREYMDAVSQGAAALAGAVRRATNETLRPLDEPAEQHRQAHQGYRGAGE